MWVDRLVRDREVRGMTQREAAERLALYTDESLPAVDSILRSWKRWERAQATPSPVYQAAIAKMFGSVPAAYFGATVERRYPSRLSADETVELVARLRASKIDDATLDAMRLTVEGLCTDYSYGNRDQLRVEARSWLGRLSEPLASQLTYRQHGDVLEMAGWLTLLVACLSWDASDATAAEQARRSAIQLGRDVDHPEILGWAAEIRAWMALTNGDLTGTVAAAREGLLVAGQTGVAVQLHAQAARAWARLGDKAHAHLALDQGRELMANLPVPTNPRNHFAVDPVKVDFYAMDIWRLLGENAMAAAVAEMISRTSTSPIDETPSPMRLAEARMCNATIHARGGDIDGALTLAESALEVNRKSRPSLLMLGGEFADEVTKIDGRKGAEYRAHLIESTEA